VVAVAAVVDTEGMDADATPARRTEADRGGRLPPLGHEALDEAGRTLWDGLTTSIGDYLVGGDGGLIGPFNAWVHAPGVGRPMAELGAAARFGTSIPRQLSEIAIITTGARWQAEFEWWAHAPMAVEHGVDEAVVEAIGKGETPPFASEDERIVWTVARQLGMTGRVDEAAYSDAVGLLSEKGMIELVTLCGYYTLISFSLNAFTVPLPPGATPQWGN
jgi:4-carboxymuconolactone decarboxylase